MNIGSRRQKSFEQWYTEKFHWFVVQPMPYRILYQVPLWLFYGFIWIPIWFLISDKTIHESPLTGRLPDSIPATQAVPSTTPSSGDTTGPESSTSLVDVNVAEESELAKLPGIGPILAKKAASYRTSSGGFDSLDQFYDVIGLKPHVISNLQQFVTLTPVQRANRGGRVVDY